MSGLELLQRALQHRILTGDGEVGAAIVAEDGSERAKRLQVYEHAYVARLVEALQRAYPALRATVGEASFAELARAHVRQLPSVYRSIRYYGAELAALVERSRPGAEGRALAELARWEWLLAQVFDAADAAPLTVGALAAVPAAAWGALELVPHPTLRRFESSTNAIELWRRATGASDSDGDLRCEPRPVEQWIAWRSELDTRFRSVEGDEAAALDALLAGRRFGEICERLAELGDPSAAPLRAAQLLRTWIAGGLLRA
jgi:hypothetical protein